MGRGRGWETKGGDTWTAETPGGRSPRGPTQEDTDRRRTHTTGGPSRRESVRGDHSGPTLVFPDLPCRPRGRPRDFRGWGAGPVVNRNTNEAGHTRSLRRVDGWESSTRDDGPSDDEARESSTGTTWKGHTPAPTSGGTSIE